MSNKPTPPTYKGRSIGIVVLVVAQILIGLIHVFSGLLLFFSENFAGLQATVAYDVYTLIFGLLVLIFAFFIWQGKKLGWVGTIAVSLFVILVDTLTLLDLPSIPGVPKFAGLTEIGCSIVIIIYLCSGGVRKKYLSR
jgi:heme A synthase